MRTMTMPDNSVEVDTIKVSTESARSYKTAGPNWVGGWGALDEVERARASQVIEVGRTPDVFGHAFSYLEEAQRRAHVRFVGHRVPVSGCEYPDELTFDARGLLQIEGETATQVVQIAGYAKRNASDFYGGTGRAFYEKSYTMTDRALLSPLNISAVVKPAPRRARHDPASPEYRACKDLASWLGINDEDVAEIIGVGRTTLYSWKRGVPPRRSRTAIRKLYQFHAIVRSLRDRLGAQQLRAWVNSSSPRPMELLEQGSLDDFERLADRIVFPRDEMPAQSIGAAEPPPAPVEMPTAADAPKKRSSRVRSSRLAS